MVLSVSNAQAPPSIDENNIHGPKIKQDDVQEGRG
ncbi:hypothetical protein BVRB_8g186530 isoform A [Beta vulgaris subsp. vulgaris]|uniref:Uncharacterized protein n=1 Tax=Beta vulgaris subsp. vulgaris TaxID=3555 RepID=A0A0J8EM50_BETVV|nr:hypothetical protein BVRB_8g186530 isoform A [Beta vulgaris subsp. vulgaris]